MGTSQIILAALASRLPLKSSIHLTGSKPHDIAAGERVKSGGDDPFASRNRNAGNENARFLRAGFVFRP